MRIELESKHLLLGHGGSDLGEEAKDQVDTSAPAYWPLRKTAQWSACSSRSNWVLVLEALVPPLSLSLADSVDFFPCHLLHSHLFMRPYASDSS